VRRKEEMEEGDARDRAQEGRRTRKRNEREEEGEREGQGGDGRKFGLPSRLGFKERMGRKGSVDVQTNLFIAIRIELKKSGKNTRVLNQKIFGTGHQLPNLSSKIWRDSLSKSKK
jgi:hypothetical protein